MIPQFSNGDLVVLVHGGTEFTGSIVEFKDHGGTEPVSGNTPAKAVVSIPREGRDPLVLTRAVAFLRPAPITNKEPNP